MTTKPSALDKQSEGKKMKGAIFSLCRKYRYVLWRIWDKSISYVNFVCLNPSTADEEKDDQTIRKCIGYAKNWGYGGMYMTNIYAFRATNPKKMIVANNPVGPENRRYVTDISRDAGLTIAAWGNNGDIQGDRILHLLNRPHYLTITKMGKPGHPLYLKKDLKPRSY